MFVIVAIDWALKEEAEGIAVFGKELAGEHAEDH